MQSLFAWRLAENAARETGTELPDADAALKRLIRDTHSIYDHFTDLLELCKTLVRAAEADTRGHHSNFIDNEWIRAVVQCPLLNHPVWEKDFNQVRLWFRDLIKTNKEFIGYAELTAPSLEEQKKFALTFFRKLLLGKTLINDYFAERVLGWSEDHHVVRGLAEKLIKSYDPTAGKPLELPLLSIDWEDDCVFMEKLFLGSVRLSDEYRQLIARNTRNWEVERLPLTDRVLLEMAVNELINFSNIPVKVTINEYIDLARQFSTPKSWQFINGILDEMSKQLRESGQIQKSGRGLIDNK